MTARPDQDTRPVSLEAARPEGATGYAGGAGYASAARSARARRATRRLGLQVLAVVSAAGLTLVGLVAITLLVRAPGTGAAPTPTAEPYLVGEVRPAAALELTGADGRAFSLTSMRGRAALVFFGYTHCPDVCPATVGIVGQVIDRIGSNVGAVFVSVDPERDTVAWLAEYLKYVPKGFAAVTGTPEAVRSTADAWGARYARVETGKAGDYSMTHTADVYLVDQQGLLRAVFPFGTQPDAMVAAIQQVLASPAASVYPPSALPTAASTASQTAPATSPPTAVPTAPPASLAPSPLPTAAPSLGPTSGALRAEIVSSSVWAGGGSPVILALYEGDRRIDDLGADVHVQLTTTLGVASGSSIAAVAVQPRGVPEVSYVATMDIPSPGWWRLAITVSHGGAASATTTSVAALDPGGTAALGGPAPAIRTPTLTDVGGDVRKVSTFEAPDLRLSRTSTVDALAAHEPFVLVIDSSRFRTTPACGKAVTMVRYLLDRWPAVPFIHLEPYEYTLISDTPVLVGALSDPHLVPASAAWGMGPDPWPATAMPWIFVVDGNGLVRAKYRDVVGTADVDVMISMILAGG